MVSKYDHAGNLQEIGDSTTVDQYGVVHAIFAPKTPRVQLLTRCGRRGIGIVGNDEVNCKDCL